MCGARRSSRGVDERGGRAIVTEMALWRVRLGKTGRLFRRARRGDGDEPVGYRDSASEASPAGQADRPDGADQLLGAPCSSTLSLADAHQAQGTGVDRDLVCSLPNGHAGRHVAPAQVPADAMVEADPGPREVFAWDARGYVVRAVTQRF
ncbi:MAG: hypothetical protein JWO63_176 [Frankiales bacterium]|nr:hypothetical protein [Frankiales bacterium]